MKTSDHLHTEAKALKVEEHLRMLCSQSLATSLQPEFASFLLVTADSGPRRMMETLQSDFLDQVEDLLVDFHLQDIRETREEIHTRAVEVAISRRKPNRVLTATSPEIQEEERQMTKGERTASHSFGSALAQTLKASRTASASATTH